MLLEVNDLRKHFPVRGTKQAVRAVDGVSFAVDAGQTFALVGESGCGKTTIAKLLLLLERPTGGSIRFQGEDVLGLRGAGLLSYRRQVQAVFQDPSSSLNPRLKVRMLLAEPLLAHAEAGDRAALRRRLEELLDIVGLPAGALDLYPHEFSGGQRQRIAVARALALQPKLIVLDEPTSALDVSIRAQIINLLSDIQRSFGLAYLVIAHDLALVEHFSSAVGVMYLGAMAESGPSANVFGAPRHPYTRALLGSAPRPDPDHQPIPGLIHGDIGSALNPPSGCRFHPRCPHAMTACAERVPAPRELPGEPKAPLPHLAACHLLDPDTPANPA
ncbi:PepT family ABC transporter ATP-binding protein [Cupriavidus basilensis OR16]|uniref:PepT family ABC transporter ATP-binding protein n=1 Tax=Cupriavidus basilensis OR16 TaxID=1127483 RepID=H1S746_9BURK|nr:oligopeptide/dipeptide ABC transporter ATP-binding protein [Cupriavidus basilensis]EHP41857.1 PepT family ABC transporter ATP-binding protein [Cupriavidus basilensis OR16]